MSLLDTHIGFVEALRSAGLSVSLAEGLDAISALEKVRWHDRETVRAAYAARNALPCLGRPAACPHRRM